LLEIIKCPLSVFADCPSRAAAACPSQDGGARTPHDRCPSQDMRMMTKTLVMLAAACMLGGTAALAAPLKHRSGAARLSAGHHAQARTHARARAFEPRFNPYAYGFQPYSSAEERWFDQAKGNIW
jgi:hypothetical protein